MICAHLAAAAPTTPGPIPTVTATVVQTVTSTVTATVDGTVLVPSGGVTWADAMQGWGTVLGAVLTFGAVVAALRANRQTRSIANRDHESAKDALREQNQLLRDQARRDFLLDLLLKIQENISTAQTMTGNSVAGQAGVLLHGLLAAVPAGQLPLTRYFYGGGRPEQREKWRQLAEAAGEDTTVTAGVMPEVARLVDLLAGADTLPEWSVNG